MKSKKWILYKKIIALVFFMVLVLTACQEKGSFIARGRMHQESGNRISSEHNYLNGYAVFRLTDESNVKIRYKIETKEGKCTFEILNVGEYENIDDETILIPNKENKVIKIKVDAKEHKGSYLFERVE